MRVVCEPCFQRSLIAPIRLTNNRYFPERKGDGKGKGKGDSKGGKGGGKGKSGGRGDPNRALPPHLCRIRALAAAQSAYSDTKFTPAGGQKSSYSYGS